MGRRNNYKGWDNRASSQGNAFGGRQSGGGQGRGGQQHNSKNAFSGGGGSGQPRQNAFSALAEPSQPPPSQPRSTQNIAQRVSYPAAQRNSFASSPANAFGGASSHSQFQPPPRQQSPLNNNGFSRPNGFGGGSRSAFSSNNAFGGSTNAFQNQGFGGNGMQQQSTAATGINAFAGVAGTPQPSGFGGLHSQFSANAVSGSMNPQQAAFSQPSAPQQSAFGGNTGSAFNAFSSSHQPAAPMGFQSQMAFKPVASSNAFAGLSPGSQPFNSPQPSGTMGGFPGSGPQNAFSNLQSGFGNAASVQQPGMGDATGFRSQMDRNSGLPGFSSGGVQGGAAKAFSEQQSLSEADQAAWMSDKFEKGMIPELPPPASVC